jgi:hypothetical protein
LEEEVEETMRLWIEGRKRDIIGATIGSIVAVIIWSLHFCDVLEVANTGFTATVIVTTKSIAARVTHNVEAKSFFIKRGCITYNLYSS